MKAMFNCKEVSQIVSESFDKKLSLWTRIRLWMHLGMCGVCFKFRKNMLRVDREVKDYADEVENSDINVLPSLPEDARNRLKRQLASMRKD